jgi:hypothetical protein
LEQLRGQLLSLFVHLVICIMYGSSRGCGCTFGGGSCVVNRAAHDIVVTDNLVWDFGFWSHINIMPDEVCGVFQLWKSGRIHLGWSAYCKLWQEEVCLPSKSIGIPGQRERCTR